MMVTSTGKLVYGQMSVHSFSELNRCLMRQARHTDNCSFFPSPTNDRYDGCLTMQAWYTTTQASVCFFLVRTWWLPQQASISAHAKVFVLSLSEYDGCLNRQVWFLYWQGFVFSLYKYNNWLNKQAFILSLSKYIQWLPQLVNIVLGQGENKRLPMYRALIRQTKLKFSFSYPYLGRYTT